MKAAWLNRWSIPLRIKVLILVLVALSASLVSYVYVGNRLIIEDKLSYIYDYNYSHLRVTSEVAERRLEGALNAVTILTTAASSDSAEAGPLPPGPVDEKGEYFSSGFAPLAKRRREAMDQVYLSRARTAGIAALELLRPLGHEKFGSLAVFGEKQGDLEAIREKLAWTPDSYRERPTLIGAVTDGYLPIGVATLDSRGEPVAALALIDLNSGFLKDMPADISTRLVDSSGHALFSTFGKELDSQAVTALEETIRKSGLDEGVQDWSAGGHEFLVGYKVLKTGKFLILSLISRDEAFRAAHNLVRRSVFLGASILLLAIGFALIFVRSITRRLREMWRATEKVSQGDFTVRVEEGGGARDEVAGLASSFNVMAERIAELVEASAEKARMEQELQTAELVQETLMPTPAFKTEGVEISSYYDHASECGGDWWHHAEVGELVYIWIADATGHGAPAALLTSAAKSAVALIERLSPMSPGKTLELLNQAMYETSKSKLLMTMFLAVINKRTGAVAYANASHEHPYLVRASAGGKITKKSFEVLNKSLGKHLGAASDSTYQDAFTKMSPGDVLVLFTDGITDLMNKDGKPLGRSVFIRSLCEVLTDEQEPGKMVERLQSKASDHRQDAALVDDVTLIVCRYGAPAPASSGKPEKIAA